jgi:anti-anti-sigma factor
VRTHCLHNGHVSDVRQVVSDSFTCEPLEGAEQGLRLTGELDIASAPKLRAACESLDGTGQVTLDLAELTFIDSSGLHALVQYANTNGTQGPLILTNVSGPVFRVFKITGLDALPTLEIHTAT